MTTFFDPNLTTDGKLYKPERYKEVVKEEIYISKNTSTPYSDVENMTPFERDIWINAIDESNKEMNEILEEKSKNKERR